VVQEGLNLKNETRNEKVEMKRLNFDVVADLARGFSAHYVGSKQNGILRIHRSELLMVQSKTPRRDTVTHDTIVTRRV
jgi:hypothetical protein